MSTDFESLESRVLLSSVISVTHSGPVLSRQRDKIGATSVGDKVIFAGGGLEFTTVFKNVDIYNTTSGTWATAQLSTPRESLGATSVDGKAIFAGGVPPSESTADIYDSNTGTWSTAPLPLPVEEPAVASVAHKAIFAESGGAVVYDSTSGRWSGIRFTHSRSLITPMLLLGNRLQITTNDVYDGTVDRFQKAQLDLPPQADLPFAFTVHTVTGPFAIYEIPNGYEIFNSLTGEWSALKGSTGFGEAMSAVTLGTDAIFAGRDGARVDIFDSTTGKWSTSRSSADRFWMGATVSGNKAYFAGGPNPNTGADVDVFTDSSPTFSLNGSFDRVGQNTLAVAVRNVGDAELPAGYSIQLTASSTRSFDSHSLLLGSATLTAPVAAGSVSVVTIPLAHPTQGLPPGGYDLIAAAAPPGRGHGVLFASQLNAFSVRPARTTPREQLPSAAELVPPATFSTQAIFSPAPAGATDTPFVKNQREVLA